MNMILHTLLMLVILPIVISKRCSIPFTSKSQRGSMERLLTKFSHHNGRLECIKNCLNSSYPCYSYMYLTVGSRCYNFDANRRMISINRGHLRNRPRQLRRTRNKYNPKNHPMMRNSVKQTRINPSQSWKRKELTKTQRVNAPATTRKKSKKNKKNNKNKRSKKSKKNKKSKKKGCNKGYTSLGEISICVKIHRDTRSWNDARKKCKSENGQLAIIKDATKNRILSAYVKKVMGIGHFWIGAKDVYKNNTFYWLDHTKMKFSNWAWKEPTHKFIGGDEDCVILRAVMQWNDYACSQRWMFICEIKLNA